MVPASMRKQRELFYEGDSINLPRILSAVHSIDLVHYDSDKSVSREGRCLRDDPADDGARRRVDRCR